MATANTVNKLTEEQQQILAKAQEQQAKREARKAEAAERQKRAQEIREKRKAAKEPLKTEQEKADDFKRLATKRTQDALKALRLLRNLSNRSQYAYTDEQVAKIMAALGDALQQIETRFEGQASKEEGFSL